MHLFGPRITKADWSGAYYIRSPKDYEKYESFYIGRHIKWIKGKRRWQKYMTDECVMCGTSLDNWGYMYDVFTTYLSDEYNDEAAVLPRNMCCNCGIKTYERVTLRQKFN